MSASASTYSMIASPATLLVMVAESWIWWPGTPLFTSHLVRARQRLDFARSARPRAHCPSSGRDRAAFSEWLRPIAQSLHRKERAPDDVQVGNRSRLLPLGMRPNLSRPHGFDVHTHDQPLVKDVNVHETVVAEDDSVQPTDGLVDLDSDAAVGPVLESKCFDKRIDHSPLPGPVVTHTVVAVHPPAFPRIRPIDVACHLPEY